MTQEDEEEFARGLAELQREMQQHQQVLALLDDHTDVAADIMTHSPFAMPLVFYHWLKMSPIKLATHWDIWRLRRRITKLEKLRVELRDINDEIRRLENEILREGES